MAIDHASIYEFEVELKNEITRYIDFIKEIGKESELVPLPEWYSRFEEWMDNSCGPFEWKNNTK